MKIKGNAPLAGCLVSVMLSFSAQSAPGQSGGAGFDGNPDRLPPGRLKTQIEKLPPAAQQRALAWLQRFDIPLQDYDFLQVDAEGGIYYADTVLPDEAGGAETQSDPAVEAIAPEDAFLLHSRPGASKVVFLDFDGHVITGTGWNSGGASSYFARPYDTDGNPASFSTNERNQIAEIWHRVSEDMAPFDIDVTTEDPGGFGPTTGHVLITADTDETGTPMPSQNAGGVAYVGVWGASYYSYYQPALVYYDNLGGGYPPYVSEAASHEFGHNLGLGHDATSSVGYYSGHGSGYVSWAPVMGVGYYNNVTQWSKGEYPDANNTQDDVAIISGKLGTRGDDHGNSTGTATPLAVDPDGTVYVTFPEIDPHNLDPANKGVIETRNDVDMFWFDTAEGYVNFNLLPAWEAFYRDNRRGANLDIEANLYDALGNLVASSDPTDDTMAQLDQYLPAGRYYLAIDGVGNSVSPYSDYGSLGFYYISGTVQPAAGDDTPPIPNPAGWWATVPTAQSSSRINMTANAASDDSGVVQYYFQCASGGPGCNDSGWQSSTSYSATGLQPDTSYGFQVKARDGSGNETALSSIRSATTLSNLVPVAADDNAVTDEGLSVSIAVLANDWDPDGGTLAIAGYQQGANGSVNQNGSSLVFTPAAGFFGTDSFTYTVTDGQDVSAPATVTVTVNEVNGPPVAADDSASVGLNSSVLIDVLANDSDPDGDSLTLVSVSGANKGDVSHDGSQVTYSSGNKRGGDSFAYTVIDGNGNSATATVSVNISPDGGGDSGDTGGGGGKCHPKKGC